MRIVRLASVPTRLMRPWLDMLRRRSSWST